MVVAAIPSVKILSVFFTTCLALSRGDQPSFCQLSAFRMRRIRSLHHLCLLGVTMQAADDGGAEPGHAGERNNGEAETARGAGKVTAVVSSILPMDPQLRVLRVLLAWQRPLQVKGVPAADSQTVLV